MDNRSRSGLRGSSLCHPTPLPHLAQAILQLKYGRKPCRKSFPQNAHHAISSMMLLAHNVGEAAGSASTRGTKSGRRHINKHAQSLWLYPCPALIVDSLEQRWHEQACAGRGLRRGGSAPDDRLWAAESGPLQRGGGQRCDRDRIRGHARARRMLDRGCYGNKQC